MNYELLPVIGACHGGLKARVAQVNPEDVGWHIVLFT